VNFWFPRVCYINMFMAAHFYVLYTYRYNLSALKTDTSTQPQNSRKFYFLSSCVCTARRWLSD